MAPDLAGIYASEGHRDFADRRGAGGRVGHSYSDTLARLVAQTLLCLAAVALGLRTESLTFPGVAALNLGILAVPLCALGLLTMVNFFNFMDGIDGLAVGQTLTAAAVLVGAAVVVHAFTV